MAFSSGLLSRPQVISPTSFVMSGDFTPTLLDNSLDTNLGQLYDLQVGRYTVLEGFVTLTINLTMNDLGTLNTGDPAKIGGLPFLVGIGPAPQAVSGYGLDLTSNVNISLCGNFVAGDQHMNILRWANSFGTETHPIAFMTRTVQLQFSGAYPI